MDTAELICTRWAPQPTDTDYLILRDLRDYLETFRTDAEIRILDFGAGCSPYRPLFPNAAYARADIAGSNNIDFAVNEDGTTNAPDASFDLVLSTQVAEHLPDAAVYLNEVHRVLAPGGKVVLTTHGVWEDHPTPGDYQRWTGDGLRRDIQRAGLTVHDIVHLSCAWRALACLCCQMLDRSADKSVWVRRIWHRLNRITQSFMDRMTKRFAIDTSGAEKLYLVVCAVAVRPA